MTKKEYEKLKQLRDLLWKLLDEESRLQGRILNVKAEIYTLEHK